MIPPALVALTPGTLERGGREELLARLRDAFAAGLPGVLLREPRLADRALLELAGEVLAARPAGTWVGIHDRVHLALALGADAVHLGFRSLAPADARAALADGAPALSIGLSTHAADDPVTWSAADYLFHGPLRAVPAKPGQPVALAPVGPAGLARAAASTPRPVLALGGLGPADVAACLAAGARGVVARSALLGAADPAEATRAFLAALARTEAAR